MSIPLILAIFVAFLLLREIIKLLIKKIKDFKLKEKAKGNGIDKESVCKKYENCWCCEYNLGEAEKEKVLKEFGAHHCGKTVSSIVNNK